MKRMRISTFLGMAMVALVGISAPISAHAQSAEEIRLDYLTLKDADMIAATQALTAKTGLMFLVEPGTEPFGRVTLSLRNVSAEDAIKYICQSGGASYRRDPNGVYIISRLGTKVATNEKPVENSTKPFVRITKKFKMLKADSRDIYGRIMYGPNYNPINLFEDINKGVLQGARSNLKSHGSGPLLMSGSGNAQPLNTIPVKGAATESGSDILLPGEAAPQRGGGGPTGAGGGGLGQGGGGLGQGGGGGQGAQLQGGQGLVGQSIDFISYDPTDNSIVVRGSEEDIAELQRYISMFDVAPKQCVIKVEFITTSSSLNRSLGFDWLYERGTIFAGNRPGSFARTGDPIFLSYATGNVTARMRALLQDGFGRVVNAPVVRTLNNQPALVQNVITTTLFVNTVVGVGNGQTIVAPQPFTLSFNTSLGVAPRINDDGTITSFINVTISDLGQLRRSPDGTEIPDQLVQAIQVVARVKSGETIALGGLTRKSETGSQSRFPILGDLPIIGQFFRASNRDLNNSELIVFVTPTVVEDDTNAGLGP